MAMIFNVLKDEELRLQEVIPIYMEKIMNFPKGSLWFKKQNDKKYAYLAFRENGKVKYKYIAPVPSVEYDRVALEIGKRKQYQADVKEMKIDLDIIRRTLKNARKE
jgi:hypothetical protein